MKSSATYQRTLMEKSNSAVRTPTETQRLNFLIAKLLAMILFSCYGESIEKEN